MAPQHGFGANAWFVGTVDVAVLAQTTLLSAEVHHFILCFGFDKKKATSKVFQPCRGTEVAFMCSMVWLHAAWHGFWPSSFFAFAGTDDVAALATPRQL